MKVRCDNGLCNRLVVIFSHLKKARKNNENLIVYWLVNQECNGHFLDVFEEIPDVTFTNNSNNCDFIGWKPCVGFEPSKFFVYQELKVIDKIKNQINNLVSFMNDDYVAIHVRRTDKVGVNNLTSDLKFVEFIERFDKKVFLATDNLRTQEKFKNIFGDRIVVSSEIFLSNQLRQTSLEIAVIDLFTCIKSKSFLGTNSSCFSNFINQFRKHEKYIKLN